MHSMLTRPLGLKLLIVPISEEGVRVMIQHRLEKVAGAKTIMQECLYLLIESIAIGRELPKSALVSWVRTRILKEFHDEILPTMTIAYLCRALTFLNSRSQLIPME